MLSWPDTKCSGTHDQPVPDLSTPIGAPSLAVAEQFDAEARAAAEEPGSPMRDEMDEDPRFPVE